MNLDSKLAAIRDATRDDVERIEMMKDLLLLDGISATERRQISEALTGIVLNRKDDLLVRQHAANEIGFYVDAVDPRLSDLCADGAEDLDLRVNLAESLKGVDT